MLITERRLSRAPTRDGPSGLGLVELMIALVVITVASMSLLFTTTTTYDGTMRQRDRVFAFQVATSLQAEIVSLAEAEQVTGQSLVDPLDTGGVSEPTLTTTTTASGVLVAPEHPSSGNYRRYGEWVWGRQIEVQPLSAVGNRNLRYVTVRVLKRQESGTELEVASLSMLVNALTEARPATQVLDAYFIAIENTPGSWVHSESIRALVTSMVNRIAQQNPGLELRTHWITKLGYGRDPVYRPYLNERVDSSQNMPEAYVYPGLMPPTNPSTYLYVPSSIAARIVTDAGERHGYDPATNPHPYALADHFNHAMRYPREIEFHGRRVGEIQKRRQEIEVAIGAGLPPPPEYDDMSEEPTLRLLLESLCTDPERYRNALIVNLHGELLPMPPLRNYSDPAKDPEGLPWVRVVTHPEELRTQRPTGGGDDVRLRVYAWVADPARYTGPDVMPLTRPIAIQVMDLDLTDGTGGLWNDVAIENLRGGASVGGDDSYYPMAGAKASSDPTLAAGEMYYEASFVDPGPGQRKYTLFELYNTPVVAPAVANGGSTRGLFANQRSRLYGLEYVPSCTEPALDFSRDLYVEGDGPKNTARWVVTVPARVFADRRWVSTASPPVYYDPNATAQPDSVLTVRTRIWDPSLADPTSSGTWPGGAETRVVQPENLSETYTWWAGTADAVPMTERCQFQGDPRHNPYKDLLSGAHDYPDGYNRFFDSLQHGVENAAADFPGLDATLLHDLWNGSVRPDAPRFLQLLREGVVRSRAFFGNVAGFAHEYFGFGADIGYRAHGEYPSGIPVDLRPFGAPGSSGFVDTFTQGRRLLRGSQPDYWWGMPWLGELFPDEVYKSQWMALDADGKIRGNLDAGTATDEFYQAPEQDVYAGSGRTAYGTAMLASTQTAGSHGLSALLNAGTNTTGYQQTALLETGLLLARGEEIQRNYRPGLLSQIVVDRPLDPVSTGPFAEEWLAPPYRTNRFAADTLFSVYDTSAALFGSQIVTLTDPGATSAGFFFVHGADNAPANTDSVLTTALLGLVHAYYESANPANPFPTDVVPRAIIRFPTETSVVSNPTSIDVLWEIEWRRWDALPYTATMPVGFAPAESTVEYVLTYSHDDGTSWRHPQDSSLARPGVRPASSLYVLPDAGAGQESYAWATPAAKYPAGRYLLRVDAYRVGERQHHAYHEKVFELER